MSLAPSRRPPSADGGFDLDYSIHDFEVDPHRDSQFLFQRVEEVMLREGLVVEGRTLDVACGVARLAAGVSERGGQGWGLEPSQEMLGLSRWLFRADRVLLVRGIAEVLPFRAGSFDRVICQGSLDHFVYPHEFMKEAARVLRPGGRLVVAAANYHSLSCRAGRLFHKWTRDFVPGRWPSGRPYWQPPPDHHHRGDLPFVQRLGGHDLWLERVYGVSLLWLFRGVGGGRWGKWLDELPSAVAQALLVTLDRIAYVAPPLADMIVSVWRPRLRPGEP